MKIEENQLKSMKINKNQCNKVKRMHRWPTWLLFLPIHAFSLRLLRYIRPQASGLRPSAQDAQPQAFSPKPETHGMNLEAGGPSFHFWEAVQKQTVTLRHVTHKTKQNNGLLPFAITMAY